MILVTLGTQDKKFTRLLEELDRLIDKKVIKEKVIVQAGYSKDYQSKNLEILDLISKDEFEDLVRNANFIITHGGVGSILTGLKFEKKVIAVPRYKKYKEHVNDHQVQIINNFNEEGYIIGVDSVSDLEEAILKIPKFKPKPYKSNKDKALALIKELIDK